MTLRETWQVTRMQKGLNFITKKHNSEAKWLFFCSSHCITLRYLCFPPEKQQINFRDTNRLVLAKVTQKSLLVRANVICPPSKFKSVLKLNLRSKFSWRWPHFFSQGRTGSQQYFWGWKSRLGTLRPWTLVSQLPDTTAERSTDSWGLCNTTRESLGC